MDLARIVLLVTSIIFAFLAIEEWIFAGKARPVHSRGRAYRIAFAAVVMAVASAVAYFQLPG